LIVAQGSTSPEVMDCCERGLALCQVDGDSPAMLPFAFGLHTCTFCRGEWDAASAQADRFLEIANACGDVASQLIGYRMIGRVQLNRGEAGPALASLELSIGLFVPERDTATTQKFGQSHEVHARSVLSLACLCTGDVSRALTVGIEAIQSADRLRHPHSTAIPLTYVGGWVFALCDAAAELERQATSLIALALEHGMGSFLPMGHGFLGRAACMHGHFERGERLLADAIDALTSIGFNLMLSGYLAWHADALRQLGRLEQAHGVIRRALSLMAHGDAMWLEPEARRIEALIVAELEGVGPALALLQGAADLARNMQSSVLERRCLATFCELGGESGAAIAHRLDSLADLSDLPVRISAALAQSSAGPVS
jgi:lambda repressor-like predicted transcriptional regulator